MKNGFKDRVKAGRSNWEGSALSNKGFVYLTSAYAFYFAMAASNNQPKASVIKVEIDTKSVYPDEDLLHFLGLPEERWRGKNFLGFKFLGERSLQDLGNVAVRPTKILRIVGRKDFDIREMMYFSDPSISPMNYKILGGYYRTLTDKWFNGEEWKGLNSTDFVLDSLKKSDNK